MASSPNEILNDAGSKYWTRAGNLRRASNVTLSYRGVELNVDYHAHGFDNEAFVECIKSITVGGVEVLALFDESQQADLCERIEQGWDEVAL